MATTAHPVRILAKSIRQASRSTFLQSQSSLTAQRPSTRVTCSPSLRLPPPPPPPFARRSYHKTPQANSAEEDSDIVQLSRSIIRQKNLALESASTAASSDAPDLDELRAELGSLTKALDDVRHAQRAYRETQELSTNDPDAELRSLASVDLPDLSAGVEESNESLKKVLLSLRPSPATPLNLAPVLIDFTPGEGGPDSCLWCLNLRSIYEKEFLKNGWKWKILSERWTAITGSSTGTEGLKECSIEVWDPRAGKRGEGEFGVYGKLKWETGVHRLQMISEADRAGRIMTSAAVVYVIPTGPLVEDSASDEDVLDMKDVRVDLMRASGPGGQNVNKVETAVRMVHMPTGITVMMQESRSQAENKAMAIKIIRSRLLEARREARNDEIQSQRKSSIRGTSKSDRIRTYNHQQGRVTDHRIGLSVPLSSVEQGGIGLETIHGELEERDQEDRLRELKEEVEAADGMS